MRLIKFVAKRLNGHLNFDDVRINESITFVTGINGCGKTSAIRAIVALLEPDVDWLAFNRFDYICVHFKIGEKLGFIAAAKDEAGFEFTYSIDGEGFSNLISNNIIRNFRKLTSHMTFHDDGERVSLTERFSELPDEFESIKMVSALPKPIFLGLDRTTVTRSDKSHRSRGISRDRSHITIRSFLDESVQEAENLATGARKTAEYEKSNVAENLRTDLLLALFNIEQNNSYSHDIPKTNDIRRLDNLRRSLKSALESTGIDGNRLAKSVDTFFSELISIGTDIQGVKIDGMHPEHPKFSNVIKWFSAGPKLATISDVEDLVNKFNAYERHIFSQTNRYLDVINSFFVDSGKIMSFTLSGDLVVSLPSGDKGNVYCLSSGERQLFVLITVLMFNSRENIPQILIIDEPELSLHLKWQENFVDALTTANPNAQLIMATHSPSIILGRDDLTVSLA